MKAPPKKIFTSMGAKYVILVTKKTLLYVSEYTNVRMLIVDNEWKKPLDMFCGPMPYVKNFELLLFINGCTHVMTLIVDKYIF